MIEVPFILLPALVALGIVAGLFGYAQAENRAFRRFIAAHSRAGRSSSIRVAEDCQ